LKSGLKTRKCTSIYDLAAITGFSYGTVSRVLNGRGRTSEAARTAILTASAESGFRPKMRARKTTVAVLVDLSHSDRHSGYQSSMVAGLIDDLSRHEIAVELFTNHNVHQLNEGLVDGIIAMPWNNQVREFLGHMRKIPRVLVNHGGLDDCSVVASDHAQSGRLAAKGFLDAGHQRVAIILDSDDWGNRQRRDGFTQYYAEHGLVLDADFCGFLSAQPPYSLLNQLLAKEPTGLFIGAEDYQLELVSILQIMGIRVPEQLSVVCMENPTISRFLNPPLTAVHQPLPVIASKAVELLLDKVQRKDLSPTTCLIDNTWIPRQSVCAFLNPAP
jgi:DNA-binding LacI/PurR family transcriptional regulator